MIRSRPTARTISRKAQKTSNRTNIQSCTAQKCGQTISANNRRFASAKFPVARQEVDHVFQITHEEPGHEIDDRFPDDVVDQRLVREAIDRREVIGDDDHLRDHQRRDRRAQKDGNADAILLQDERIGEGEQLKRGKEKQRDPGSNSRPSCFNF